MSDSSNEARAFGYYGVTVGCGFIFGGAMGGLLSVPNETWGLKVALFDDHPYILPCVVYSGFCLLALILAATTLPAGETTTTTPHDSTETTSITADKPQDDDATPTTSEPWDLFQMVALLSFPLISFIQVMYIELFVMWSSTDPKSGGLGFSVGELGLALTVKSFHGVMIQLLLYPPAARLLGIYNGMTTGYYLYAVSVFCLVYLNLLNEMKVVLWLVLLLVIKPVNVLAGCLASTNAAVFINRLGKKRNDPDAIYNLGHTLAGISKVVAPIASGGIFGWSIAAGSKHVWPLDVSLAFNTMAIVCILGAGFSAILNETKI